MGFVKDRHDDKGKVLAPPEVRRAGRINLGRAGEGGGAEALPYFTFVPYDKDLTAEALLSQVRDALERYAPGQNMSEPTILPVFLPADTLDLMASSTYKLAGKGGITRCAGNGEHVQFKLGARNLLEVHHGNVTTSSVMIDGVEHKQGDTVRCPGQSHDKRWSHCEKCRLQFTIDFQIADLPYFWSLTTGDQKFYTQFFTVLELMASNISKGYAQFISDIPLLLRREEGKIARPEKASGGTELRFQDMPLLSIEIHPVWLKQQSDTKVKALGAAPNPPPKLEEPAAASEPPWYEKADYDLPERPWAPEIVAAYITATMGHYSKEHEDFDAPVSDEQDRFVKNILFEALHQELGGEESVIARDLVLWYLFDWTGTLVMNQAKSLLHWAKRPIVWHGKEGWTTAETFHDELKALFDEATRAAELSGQEAPMTPEEEMARMGAVKVEYKEKEIDSGT
jgi:hypothetical protein